MDDRHRHRFCVKSICDTPPLSFVTLNVYEFKPHSPLEAVLLEYKQFLAARTIQRHVRGWLCRCNFRRQDRAATNIAKWWRGSRLRRNRFSMIEEELTRRTIKHYNDSATLIQSHFRGWQTRLNYHDFNAMRALRAQYAEDMLCALAVTLYRMRKDNMLPGIYDLRKSNSLKRIEDLSATFGYRFHNGRVQADIALKRAALAIRRNEFRSANLYTRAPFPGPTSMLISKFDIALLKKIGTQHQRVIMLFEKSMRYRHMMRIHLNVSLRIRKNMAIYRESLRSRFCRGIVKRMLRTTGIELPSGKSVIQKFIDDLLTEVMEYNCYCKPQINDSGWCI